MSVGTLQSRSFITDALEENLREKRRQKGPRPTADGTRGRGSKARHCAREIALGCHGIPAEREPSYRSMIAFYVGQSVHDEIDRVLVREFNARTEVPISYRPDHDFSGNADFVYDFNPETGERRPNLVTGETKSMGSWGFKIAMGEWKNKQAMPGPKIEHVTQAALYGNSPQLRSDYLHMVYFNKDNGTMAEWILGIDDPLEHLAGTPTPRQLALTELERLDGIFALMDSGEVPGRIVPGGFGESLKITEVPDPDGKDGEFLCRVCDFNDLCRRLPADRCKVEDVEAAIREQDAERTAATLLATTPARIEETEMW